MIQIVFFLVVQKRRRCKKNRVPLGGRVQWRVAQWERRDWGATFDFSDPSLGGPEHVSNVGVLKRSPHPGPCLPRLCELGLPPVA